LGWQASNILMTASKPPLDASIKYSDDGLLGDEDVHGQAVQDALDAVIHSSSLTRIKL
jgi:hypothetical protein